MRIKEKPEDFIVNEEANLKISKGNYSYFLLVKKNWNTIDVIKEISKRLKIKEKNIGFAGNKDKIALTSQHISIYNVNPERVINLKIKDVELSYLGNGKERINLGDLNGNHFIITIKDCNEIKKIKSFVNYFGEQRFGVEKKNWKIGKLLVSKKFKDACSELDLEVSRNDYIGALKEFGIRKLKFYVHSYQSYLWNNLVEEMKKEKKKIPFVGYLYDGDLYEEILKKEGITNMDFLIRSLKEISAEGGERDMIVDVKDFKAEKKGKDYVVSFFLPKGSYATEVIKQIVL